jgi:hypothetical protein
VKPEQKADWRDVLMTGSQNFAPKSGHGSIAASGPHLSVRNPYDRPMILHVARTTESTDWQGPWERTETRETYRIGPGATEVFGPEEGVWFTVQGVTE